MNKGHGSQKGSDSQNSSKQYPKPMLEESFLDNCSSSGVPDHVLKLFAWTFSLGLAIAMLEHIICGVCVCVFVEGRPS